MKFLKLCPSIATAFLLCFLLLMFAGVRQTAAQISGDELLPDGTKSDGCTLIGGKEFRSCCVAHDRDYYFGGTWKERFESDKRLYRCVRGKKSFGAKLAAPFIWLGVRIGGVPFLSTPFRWGFGKFRKPKKVEAPPGAEANPVNCRP